MGLDTSFDCWHGSYSGFSEWRNGLAEIAGYRLESYEAEIGEGFTHMFKRIAGLPWEQYEEKNYLGKWDKYPNDPLLILMVHSDHEGELPVDRLLPLAKRLEGLLDGFSEKRLLERWKREATINFILGLLNAAKAGEPVEFF